MLLLAVDTSAKATSVCLVAEHGAAPPKILGEFFLNVTLPHSKTMMSLCENLFALCEISQKQVDVFAISQGPGSFTGLRIGMSAIKGMAYAAQKPCIGISTLEAIAGLAPCFTGIVCAVMDARAGGVYHVAYAQYGGRRERLSADQALTFAELESLLLRYEQPILLLGDGAAICYEKFSAQIPHLLLAPEPQRYQRASAVAMAALEEIAAGAAENLLSLAALTPTYLRGTPRP